MSARPMVENEMTIQCKMATLSDRWIKRREAVEKWKVMHYAYYLEQKRRLAHRPEYLAHRRALYKARRSDARSACLSTIEILNEFEETDERPDHCLDCEPESAKGPSLGDWPRVA